VTRVNITYPVDALVSYHYYRDDADMAALANSGRLRMIGDSGAFSAYSQGAEITLDEYAAWARRWRSHLFWVASLDVLYDPQASLGNWRALRDRHGMVTVPTVHLGSPPQLLDTYAAEGVDFIGLGGMVGKPQPAVFRWSLHLIRYARDHHPGMRFHAWGLAGRQFLDRLPVYSADSSGIVGQAFRYAQLRLFDPVTGRDIKVRLDGSNQIMRHGPLLRNVYGVDPADIRTSHAGNRFILIRLLAASAQQYGLWLQKRHRVSPPTWGINPAAPNGPRVHMVGSPRQGRATPNQALDLLYENEQGAPEGPRVHMVGGSHSGPPYLDQAVTDEAPDGPRVHLVAGGRRGMNQDPRNLWTEGPPYPDEAPVGPRVHMVGGGPSAGSNQRLQNLWDAPDGPRVYLVGTPSDGVFRAIDNANREPTS
jgi:hypothetical protein